MNMNAFINRNRVRIHSDWADSNPNNPEWRDANHYKCRLRMGNKQMTVYFSQGYGVCGEPTAAGVLDCLASDSAGVDNARSFEEWCSEYGYDTDSRKAERIYKVCVRQAGKLRTFLGVDLYETLLWKTERE